MKKKNLTITQVKEFLLKKGLIIIKKNNKNPSIKNLQSIYYVSLVSIFLIMKALI